MPLPKKVKDIVGPLNLIPHPEGGFFVETYRSGSEPMSTMVSYLVKSTSNGSL
jgi:predicted cupin superfamily sugar epimerase